MDSRRSIEGMDEWLTYEQVAIQLAVSTRTVHRMVKAGMLPQPVRYNHKLVRFSRRAIELHQAQMVSACSEPRPLVE